MLRLVPTPIGNLDDISKRSLDALFGAQTILCEDTRVTKKLLHLLSERHHRPLPEASYISLHSHNEKDFIDRLDQSFFEQELVYVSDAGMPGISDPGQLLIDYCLRHAIEYEVLAGASASILAFVASGFVKTEFLFWGFLDHKGQSRSDKLKRLIYSGYTAIIYEAPTRLIKLLEELASLDAHRRIFLAKELSKKYETKIRTTAQEALNRLKTQSIKGEWIVVVEAAKPKAALELDQEAIMSLNIHSKEKAKLLAKLGDKSAKAWYKILEAQK